MPVIDPTIATNLAGVLCQNYADETNSFSAKHPVSVQHFTEIMAYCHTKINQYASLVKNEKDEQAKIAERYLDLAINNLFSSMQLLIIEHIIASGNMFRQAVEATCIAILLSHRGELRTTYKKNGKKIEENFLFLDIFMEDKHYKWPYLYLPLIEKNKSALGIDAEFIEVFKAAQRVFNGYSHASKKTINLSQSGGIGSRLFIGGGIGHPEKNLLDFELKARINFSKKIPTIIDYIYKLLHLQTPETSDTKS
ncbi:hypothetical protein ACG1BZ_05265 [Microbulbifer sp. CNSA002]|uniref:hypothetical protein n=1 Tax=unclassified Microbulbifer TaxID=2619833 RepID=UPI0039B66B02